MSSNGASPLESFADLLYGSMRPLAWLDGESGYALAHLAGGVGTMFQEVQDLARDTPQGVGWSAVVDLQRCPDNWLPWLAQFVGVSIPGGLMPADQRAWIAGADGFNRGTPAALRAAAGAYLTGDKTVFFRERDPSGAVPPYTLEVVTVESETPDPDVVLAALMAQKPAGLVLTYRTVVGWDYQEQTATSTTYTALASDFATYRDLANNEGV
jgi:tail protein P2 I